MTTLITSGLNDQELAEGHGLDVVRRYLTNATRVLRVAPVHLPEQLVVLVQARRWIDSAVSAASALQRQLEDRVTEPDTAVVGLRARRPAQEPATVELDLDDLELVDDRR